MKHAFWDRVLIILCTLLLLGLAALLLGLVMGFVPLSLILENANQVVTNRGVRIVFSAAAALLAVFALLVFWIALPRRKGRYSTFAIQQTEHGALKISVKALEHLVQKCISQHPELTIVSSTIHSNEETVRVDLRVTLQSDINIPLAISSLQKQIKQYVEACSGVDVDEVRVVVESTVPPVPGTNSPYAIPEMLQPHLPKLPESSLPAQPLLDPVPDPVPAPEPPPPIVIEVEPKPEHAPIVEDTSWMDTKPVDLRKEADAAPVFTPEPMPDWLLEREPGEHAVHENGEPAWDDAQENDNAPAQDALYGQDRASEGENHRDSEEGE